MFVNALHVVLCSVARGPGNHRRPSSQSCPCGTPVSVSDRLPVRGAASIWDHGVREQDPCARPEHPGVAEHTSGGQKQDLQLVLGEEPYRWPSMLSMSIELTVVNQ